MAGKRLEVSRQTAEETFERGLTSECLPSVIVDPQHVAQDGLSILDALVTAGLVGSKGEARRLLRGGVRLNDQKLSNEEARLQRMISIRGRYASLPDVSATMFCYVLRKDDFFI